jgi:hypothetical protein
MKKTLESFIDPVNIPKKYGGELEFQFGDMPVLDPALEKVLTWEGSNNDFPRGPMYWVHKKDEPEIEAIARGSVDEKERNEGVCIVKKMLRDDEDREVMNGHATTGTENTKPEPKLLPVPGSVLLTAPTVPPSPATSTANLNAPQPAMPEVEKVVVQGGEVVPESRPEFQSFVTAHEGLNGLTLNEKAGNLTNGSAGPHTADIANEIDPTMNLNGSRELENAPVHHEKKEMVGEVV